MTSTRPIIAAAALAASALGTLPAAAQDFDLCAETGDDLASGFSELFAGTWRVEYLAGTFTVAGMVQPIPPTPPDTVQLVDGGGVLTAPGTEAFGGFEFRIVDANLLEIDPGLPEMTYDRALDLFTPVECDDSSVQLFADGRMETADGHIDMDMFLTPVSLTRMTGFIYGDVQDAIFILREIAMTRTSPVPEVPDDLLPVGDGSPGSTAPGNDLLPVGDGSPGSTAPDDDLLPIGDGSPGSTAPGDDLQPIGDGSPGSTAPEGGDLLPLK
ncbi:hypothetical protein HKCCE3408_13280 [Rhodobacterales bacterium HKCCE3408]|nr:hypothetical protein [Rhodobacterales bacterium HKCCE3408]